MKTFLGSMLGSFIGAVIGLVIIFFITIGIFAGLLKNIKTKEVQHVYNNSILEIKLNHAILERTAEAPFHFDFDDNIPSRETAGLSDIISCIRHAATDSKIKGIYLNLSDIPAGISTIETIRKELKDFKTSSGKFIIAYAIGYSQKSYYLASVADKIYLYPEGEIFLKGLSVEMMFYKKALDKLGVQIQVFRHGRFKSFVEPYILDKMSPDNRLQLRGLITSIWGDMLADIADSRHLTVRAINQMADSLSISSAKEALKYKLIDSLLYPDEIKMELKNSSSKPEGLVGANKKDDETNFVGLDEYRGSFNADKYSSKKIAVIYANGEIIQGEGDDQTMGSTRIARAIRDARLDAEVKAIVLRVNSPGGDGIASDIIWREVDLARKEKPVVVSMGDYAASGGYYISCAASEIVAEPTTITGSIGVFGLLPNAKELMEDKLGITTDTVNTNTHSSAPSISYPLETKEAKVLQNAIEDFYHTFLTRVSNGRNITVANVDSIGQGRVWSGTQARKIGLVDTLGSIKVAINIAAKKANISDYSIEELPHQLNPFHKLMSNFGAESAEAFLKEALGDAYKPIGDIEKLQNTKGVQARIPYDINIK